MSHVYAARGSRQTAILAAIVGLHFAVFLVVAGSKITVTPVNPPSLPVTVLPKPKPEQEVIAPPPGQPAEYYPGVYPEPEIPIPDFTRNEQPAVPVREGVTGEGVTIVPPVDFVPPALRTRPANVAAAINACYPAASRRMNEEGTVVALVTIGAAGSAANWSVAQSSGFARLDAAIPCVLRKLDFVAGRRDGQAVSAEARLPIVFRLD